MEKHPRRGYHHKKKIDSHKTCFRNLYARNFINRTICILQLSGNWFISAN